MNQPIPPLLQHLVARELARGERVVWLARPAPLDRVLASTGTFLSGILILAFAAAWTLGATGHVPRMTIDVSLPFADLFGGVLALASVSMLLSPLRAWWVAQRTLYAVTDRRAILIEVPLRRATVQSFKGECLAAVVRRERSSGRGDLIFEREASKGSKGRTVYRDVGFFGIEDVRAVQQLLPTQPAAPGAAGRRALGAQDA